MVRKMCPARFLAGHFFHGLYTGSAVHGFEHRIAIDERRS